MLGGLLFTIFWDRKREKCQSPIPSARPAPDGGVGRGSGELANHAVVYQV